MPDTTEPDLQWGSSLPDHLEFVDVFQRWNDDTATAFDAKSWKAQLSSAARAKIVR
jgi:hypothetical protein